MTIRLRKHPDVIGTIVEICDDGLGDCSGPSAETGALARADELYNVYYGEDHWFRSPHQDRTERYIEVMVKKHPALEGKGRYWRLDVSTGQTTELSLTKKVVSPPDDVLA